VTERERLDSFIARYTPEVASIAREAFAWMRRKYPRAWLLVYDNYNALAIGFSPTERTSEAVVSIALYPKWVSFFFLWGASLPDPTHCLKGSGKQARHLILNSVEALEDPAVLALLDIAAAKLGGGSGKIVIKSVSEKQRPRRPLAVKKAVKQR